MVLFNSFYRQISSQNTKWLATLCQKSSHMGTIKKTPKLIFTRNLSNNKTTNTSRKLGKYVCDKREVINDKQTLYKRYLNPLQILF